MGLGVRLEHLFILRSRHGSGENHRAARLDDGQPGERPRERPRILGDRPLSGSYFDVPDRPRILFPQDEVGLPLFFPDNEDPPVSGKGLGFHDLGVADGETRHARPFEDPLESRADPNRL